MEKPLVEQDYVLIKTGGKCAWTFVEIPEIPMPKTSFGMLKVKGKMDDYEFSNTHLMPIGNGHVGLPINAQIRKKLKKQAGDTVHLIIYEDKTPLIIPKELLLCMEDETGLTEKFEKYIHGQKKVLSIGLILPRQKRLRPNALQRRLQWYRTARSSIKKNTDRLSNQTSEPSPANDRICRTVSARILSTPYCVKRNTLE